MKPKSLRCRCPVCAAKMSARVAVDDFEHEECRRGCYSFTYRYKRFTEVVEGQEFAWDFGAPEEQEMESKVAEAMERARVALGLKPQLEAGVMA